MTDATPQRSEKRAQTLRQHRNRRPSVHAGSLRFRDCLTKDDRVSKEESHLCDSRILQSANSEIKQVLRYKCSGKLPKDDQRSCASVPTLVSKPYYGRKRYSRFRSSSPFIKPVVTHRRTQKERDEMEESHKLLLVLQHYCTGRSAEEDLDSRTGQMNRPPIGQQRSGDADTNFRYSLRGSQPAHNTTHSGSEEGRRRSEIH